MEFIPQNYIEFDSKSKLIQHKITKEFMFLRRIGPNHENTLAALKILDSDNLKPKGLQKFQLIKGPTPTDDYFLSAFHPDSLKNLTKSSIPFARLLFYFTESVRVLAYLQSKKIAIHNLKPAQFLLEEETQRLLLKIGSLCSFYPDYSRSIHDKIKMTMMGTPKYLSPELTEAYENVIDTIQSDPFKSDVFSFGLTFLKLAESVHPKLEKSEEAWNVSLNQRLAKISGKYEQLLKTEDERRQLDFFKECLKECLQWKVERRPDFIDLFYKTLNFKEDCFCDHFRLEENRGSFGLVRKGQHKTVQDHTFAIKTMGALGTEGTDQQDILKEIKIWEKLESSQKKPQGIPNYYGHFTEITSSAGTFYHLVFDYFPNTLASLIHKLKKEGLTFPFEKLHSNASSLINTMAFLQAMGLCHRDLKPGNLLLNESQDQVFLIDFGEGKEFSQDLLTMTKKLMKAGGTEIYMSPEFRKALKTGEENVFCNPFKSDVFSFGLVFLELGTLERLKRETDVNLEKNIAALIKKFEDIYAPLAKDPKEKEVLGEFLMILQDCLRLDPTHRPDFYRLFWRNLNLKYEDPEKIKDIILIKDMGKSLWK